MTCHAQNTPHPLHHIKISLDVPGGWARCWTCGQVMTGETWASTECVPDVLPTVWLSADLGGLPVACSHCGATVSVDPTWAGLHDVFGTLCSACCRAQDDARRMID